MQTLIKSTNLVEKFKRHYYSLSKLVYRNFHRSTSVVVKFKMHCYFHPSLPIEIFINLQV